jgi:hypothetical protein
MGGNTAEINPTNTVTPLTTARTNLREAAMFLATRVVVFVLIRSTPAQPTRLRTAISS